MFGKVRWINFKNDFGFIEKVDDTDILIKFSTINVKTINPTGCKTLFEGQYVKFDTKQGAEGLEAINIVPWD